MTNSHNIETISNNQFAQNAKRWFARRDWYSFTEDYGVLIALVLLLLVNIVITPYFLTWQTLYVNLTQVSTIIILSVGMTFVIASGGIDLSVGAVMAIAGSLAPLIFTSQFFASDSVTLVVFWAILIPIIVAGFCGWFNGWLITNFSIQPIIATLILFIAGRGLAQVMTNGNLQVFNFPAFQFMGLGRVAGIPCQVLITIVIIAIAAVILRKTVFGRHALAIGGSPKAAFMIGIPVKKVLWTIYIGNACLAGLAGLIVVARNSASDANLVGMGNELDAIAAVAVGGTALSGGRATLIGTVFGALLIQLMRFSLLANGVPDAAALVIKALLIILAVWIQSQAQRRRK